MKDSLFEIKRTKLLNLANFDFTCAKTMGLPLLSVKSLHPDIKLVCYQIND